MRRKLIRNEEEYNEACNELHTGFGTPDSYPFMLLHSDPPGTGKTYKWEIVYLFEFVEPNYEDECQLNEAEINLEWLIHHFGDEDPETKAQAELVERLKKQNTSSGRSLNE